MIKTPTKAILDDLLTLIGISQQDTGGTIQILGEEPLVASPHRIATASATALAAQGAAIATIWKMCGGRGQSVTVDIRDALHGLHTIDYLFQERHRVEHHVLKEPTVNFYRAGDGRWLFFTGSYPHLRNGILDVLGCPNSAKAIANATARWHAADLEEALAQRGLAGAMVRTRDEWLTHPQGKILAEMPVIQIKKIGESAPEPFYPRPRPLTGTRVLDLSHVIAGPLMSRVLTEQGADVLHITSPEHPDSEIMVMDTGPGKRNAYLEFGNQEDMQQLHQLACSADIFVDSWRPGVMARQGFSPQALAARRPGIIYVTFSCYGPHGLFSQRGGFEQQGQSVTGIAAEEGTLDCPRLTPVRYLNDYVTAYLGAAGALTALIRRGREGGSYHINVALARTSMWVQEMGLFPLEVYQHLPQRDLELPKMQTTQTAWGELEHMAPITQYSETPAFWSLPPTPLGSAKPGWASQSE